MSKCNKKSTANYFLMTVIWTWTFSSNRSILFHECATKKEWINNTIRSCKTDICTKFVYSSCIMVNQMVYFYCTTRSKAKWRQQIDCVLLIYNVSIKSYSPFQGKKKLSITMMPKTEQFWSDDIQCLLHCQVFQICNMFSKEESMALHVQMYPYEYLINYVFEELIWEK